MRHGWTLIGKVKREMFSTNASTSGQLRIELASTRDAIVKAPAPKATAPKRKRQAAT